MAKHVSAAVVFFLWLICVTLAPFYGQNNNPTVGKLSVGIPGRNWQILYFEKPTEDKMARENLAHTLLCCCYSLCCSDWLVEKSIVKALLLSPITWAIAVCYCLFSGSPPTRVQFQFFFFVNWLIKNCLAGGKIKLFLSQMCLVSSTRCLVSLYQTFVLACSSMYQKKKKKDQCWGVIS